MRVSRSAMIYDEIEIEAFEVGRGPTSGSCACAIDGIEFEFLNVGLALSSHDAALADARGFIDRIRSNSPTDRGSTSRIDDFLDANRRRRRCIPSPMDGFNKAGREIALVAFRA
jgi:hypothetical protein